MKTGDIIQVAFKTNGDVSVIYYGQDTNCNFGYLDKTRKDIEMRLLVLDDARGDGWHCHYKNTNQRMYFLTKYIKGSMEWIKNNF